MHYHLTQPKRIELSLLLRLGHSQRQAAATLGVAPSTVSRELRRNCRLSGQYHATSARLHSRDRRAIANALRIKLFNEPLAHMVAQKLRANWAPEQIAGWLKRTYPDDEDYQVPFPLTAKLAKLTLKLGRPKLSAEDLKKLEEAATQVEAGRE